MGQWDSFGFIIKNTGCLGYIGYCTTQFAVGIFRDTQYLEVQDTVGTWLYVGL